MRETQPFRWTEGRCGLHGSWDLNNKPVTQSALNVCVHRGDTGRKECLAGILKLEFAGDA